jgi:tetratricopeptide (TPR) repeat protein
MAVELGDQEILGGFYVRLGSCEGWHGKLDKSIPTLTKAIELCEASGNIEGARYAYLNLIESHFYLGDFDQILTIGEKAFKILDSTFDPYSYVYTVSQISWTYSYIGCWDRAVEEGQKALSIAKRLSNNDLISFASFNIVYSYIQKGDLPRAVEYGELAVEKAPTPAESVFSQAPLGWALCKAGEVSRGINLLIQLLPEIQAAGYLPFEVEVRVMLGEGYLLSEEFEESRQILEEAIGLAEQLKMKYFIGRANRLLGEIAIVTNLNRAAAHFDKSVNICKKIGADNELAFAFASYGRLHKHQGNIAEAMEYFEKAIEIFGRFGNLIEPEKIRKELAELPEA